MLGDRPALTARGARAASFVLTQMRRDGRLSAEPQAGRATIARLPRRLCLHRRAGCSISTRPPGAPAGSARRSPCRPCSTATTGTRTRGGYFRTSDDHEPLLAREKPDYDGAEPSGNSVTLLNLLRLHELTLDDRYRARAERLVRACSPILSQQPTALGDLLLGLDFALARPLEVLIVAPATREQAEPLLAAARRAYAPASVLAVTTAADRTEQERLIPAFNGKLPIDERATAYVCRAGTCQLPLTDPAELAARLSAREVEDAPRAPDVQGISPKTD